MAPAEKNPKVGKKSQRKPPLATRKRSVRRRASRHTRSTSSKSPKSNLS
ncbi:hypothetical protein WN944_010472 [Citrus x changshan-huyou]|uniref:Uncharacterized protein n=1 Tax=Citrus x changshan-huyou TaxID=2935761 RepID=A0AAP0QXW1_9ROSI